MTTPKPPAPEDEVHRRRKTHGRWSWWESVDVLPLALLLLTILACGSSIVAIGLVCSTIPLTKKAVAPPTINEIQHDKSDQKKVDPP